MFIEVTKKCVYFGVFILLLAGIISCEKDFKDIGMSVVNNNKFITKDTILEIVITNKEIKSVRADGLSLGRPLDKYLLGVYNNPNYEKIEASIISQIILDKELNKININGTVATIDTVFLKLPYQATLKSGTKNEFTLDSIIGDQTKAFTLNVYQSDTYLNRLNPTNPSKTNSYQSDYVYQKKSDELNTELNYQFKPNANDTVIYIKRRSSLGAIYKIDTVKLDKNRPFARIPLNENKIKKLFLEKYGSSEFASQEAFNEYFKGLYIEASGNEGSLIPFNISGTELRPSIEIYYTNTVFKDEEIDTILEKKNSFSLSNFSNSIYKMTDKTYPEDGNIIIQGTAGNKAEIKLFTSDKIEELRKKDWLINDASLTFYVNQDVVQFDTIATPHQLFLYKKNASNSSQVIDIIVEGVEIFGGRLELSEKKPNKYTFRITKYVSDLLSGKSDYNPSLELRVFNPTDLLRDTIVRTYNWNPRAVTILNHLSSNGERKARLKISYSKKK